MGRHEILHNLKIVLKSAQVNVPFHLMIADEVFFFLTHRASVVPSQTVASCKL